MGTIIQRELVVLVQSGVHGPRTVGLELHTPRRAQSHLTSCEFLFQDSPLGHPRNLEFHFLQHLRFLTRRGAGKEIEHAVVESDDLR